MSDRKSDKRPPICRSSTLNETDRERGQHPDEEEAEEHERTNSNPEVPQTVVFRCGDPIPIVTKKSSSSNTSIPEGNRSRSKTVSMTASDAESQKSIQINSQPPAPPPPPPPPASASSTGFHILQSLKDLTHQELYRANPLGLLGKEVISATGTTHCPEPIPPAEDDGAVIGTGPSSSSSVSPNKLTSISENEPQQLQFQLTEEEQIQMQRRRSSMGMGGGTNALPPCPAEFMRDEDDTHGAPQLFSQLTPGTMVADFIPDTMTINVFEVFIYAWGVFAFFFDMVTDLVLAHAYYQDGAYWLFLLTLMCVIVPNLTLSVFSLVWYIDGSQLKAAANGQTPFSNDASSSCETSSSEETLNKHREEDVQQLNGTMNDTRRRVVAISTSESIPLHTQRNSFCQTDDIAIEGVDEDQTDAHVSRARHRPQPPEQQQCVPEIPRRRFQLSSATANVLTWIIRIIILVLQLDLCLKYIRGLYYTWKGFQKRHNPKWARFYLTKQILIDADIALLRVFDCFMDSGSQVILQLYIMLRLGSAAIKFDTLFAKQSLSIVSSLGSLAYALSGYSRCWRHMQLTHSPTGWPKNKPAPKLVSWWSTIIQWVWYLFLITPRVLALAMFAATFRSWFWIILVGHWCGMLFWILRFRTIFCISDQTKYNPREAIFEKCYNLVCSYIFIFCYMNLRKGDTRSHYIGFYTIYYIENIAFSIIYALHSAETNTIFKYSLVTFVCVGFWFAVFFQLMYYRFLHPSDHVRANTKRDVGSIVRVRPLLRFGRMKKSKSCEVFIGRGGMTTGSDPHNQNENNELVETTSLALTTSSLDERWHNRFSKENRQKLISQQQAIDQKVKLTRAQKQLEDASKRNQQQQQSSTTFFSKLSTSLKRPATIAASLSTTSSDGSDSQTPVVSVNSRRRPFFDVPRVSLNRQQQESYAKMPPEDDEEEEIEFDPSIVAYVSTKHPSYKHQPKTTMYNIDEDSQAFDDNKSSISLRTCTAAPLAGRQEMILTASKLTPLIKLSSSSSTPATNSRNLHHTPSTTAASLC